jgi:hypothetical protein
MRRKTALIFSGIVTAFAMVCMIGLFGLSARHGNTVQAAPVVQSGDAVSFDRSGQLSTDTAILQAEVIAYRQQLQEAYLALQQAYAEIQLLSSDGSRNFRDRADPGQSQLFNQGLGDD